MPSLVPASSYGAPAWVFPGRVNWVTGSVCLAVLPLRLPIYALLPATLALSLAPFGVVAGIPAFSLTWMLPLVMLTIAFVAANMALQYGAARLPARITALVMLSELIFAVLSAVAIGGETLGLLTVFGALLILGATLWGLFDVKREGKGP
ncbi:MAG: DMT family transporter [Betaproteobacteria bacterium]|nr:DMT family transporter [Betaproteobacteria bacterium]